MATAVLLRVWADMPPVAQLELREVVPELVHALDGFHAAEVALLAAKQEREQAEARLGLTERAHSIAAVHEGMGR